jgi:DNA-binding NtrC family response regulator
MGEGEAFVENIETARRRFEGVYLRSLLAKTGNNVAKAARLAGVTRQGLYRLLHRNGLGPHRGSGLPVGAQVRRADDGDDDDNPSGG